MELLIYPSGEARWKDRSCPCTLGRNGIVDDKTEGDGGTPAGAFGFLRVLYRPDRMAKPVTVLPVAALTPEAGWCDAPGDAAYNRQVVLPYAASCESLWREDHVYDLIVVTSHNTDPTIDGRGSGIFVHLMREDRGPTEGCVAFQPGDLRRILADWDSGDTIRIPAR